MIKNDSKSNYPILEGKLRQSIGVNLDFSHRLPYHPAASSEWSEIVPKTRDFNDVEFIGKLGFEYGTLSSNQKCLILSREEYEIVFRNESNQSHTEIDEGISVGINYTGNDFSKGLQFVDSSRRLVAERWNSVYQARVVAKKQLLLDFKIK